MKGDNLPSINDHCHRIDLNAQEPIVSKLYRYRHPLHLRDEVDSQIEQFEREGIINPTSAQFGVCQNE